MRFFKKHPFITIILIGISYFIYQNYTRVVDYNRNKDTKSSHFINELYQSDERIYNKFLSNEDKKMYDLILKNTLKYKTTISIDLEKYGFYDYIDCADFIDYANSALYVDHPELMNYAGYRWSYRSNKFTLYLQHAYYNPLKDAMGVLRIEKVISDIKEATKNMNDKEKIIYIYNWMAENNTYDHIFTFASKNQSIYNVFVKKNAVCAGFAKASQIIFTNLGIESYVVQGESSGPHMWNIIKYKGKYYYFDSTISVSIKNKESDYYYNGLKQEKMNDYSMKFPEWYPKVESTNMFEE